MSSLAHWCLRRRTVVVTAWIALLIGLAAAVVSAGTGFTDTTNVPDSDSATGYSLIARAGGPQAAALSADSGTIAWQTTGVSIDDPSVKQQVSTALADIAALPDVIGVSSPYSDMGGEQVDSTTNTAFATVDFIKDSDTDAASDIAKDLQTSTIDVQMGGDAFSVQPGGGSHITEVIGIVAAFALLLLVFRSVWAALLPILTGIMGVGTSLLAVMLISHVLDMSATSLTMGALIGLGVGIDYALFIVHRHRTALMNGHSVRDSIAQAVGTSGRAVIFAGLTVVIALLGMFVVNLSILTGMSRAAALTVLFTVATAITLLPALLAMLGTRVLSKKQRAALAAGDTNSAESKGVAARWAALVQASPVKFAALAAVLIGVVAAPVVALQVGTADSSSDPAGSPGNSYHQMMAEGFGDGFDAPILLVAQAPDDASKQVFTDYTQTVSGLPDVADVVADQQSAGSEILVATVTPASSGQQEATNDLVADLRAGAPEGLNVHVTGSVASNIDMADALMSKLPLYLGLIALLGFLLLAMAFRSVLVPLLGAVSNLFTILVGLGAITAVFQFGWGSELLGVGGGAPIEYLVPVLIVGVMFGLSMDYQVFLISRMHEEWTTTGDSRAAVRVGVGETGRVIAAAATIMLCVFASFGFSGERIVAAIGIGMAIAVVLDAFVIRLILMPALMTLIGSKVWWFPSWAERITPRVSIEGPVDTGASDDRLLESEVRS
ncbi:RND superfamily putative drug exporter [Williamsia limnetica]|uniref:RND superfamily putative drug exporter n=1 Tax=Williamsia limnetica TaxID=882452 RepID=A0A318RGV7_WILLI|nr:MMPL family transporter [Williamsia limnetica]PYE16308.1 RND superfamily putative drug exporter [Williamsia limnetica]